MEVWTRRVVAPMSLKQAKQTTLLETTGDGILSAILYYVTTIQILTAR